VKERKKKERKKVKKVFGAKVLSNFCLKNIEEEFFGKEK